MKTREIALGSMLLGALVALACGDDGAGSNGGQPGSSGSAGSNGGEDPGGQAGTAGKAGSAGSSGATSGAGGEGGSGSVPGPPMLVRTTPEPDATNVWFYAPIELVFNEPLDPATVAGSVTVSVDGSPLAASVELSTEGTTIVVVLEEPPTMAATATVEVSDRLADLDAEEFAGVSWDYELPLWQRPGSGLGSRAAKPVVAAGVDGALFAARIEGDELLVDGWDGSAWQRLDGLDAPGTGDPALATDAAGRPLVAWAGTADGGGQGILVRRWSGSAWQAVGELIDAPGAVGLELAFGASDEPVLAFATAARTVRIERFTAGSWETLDDSLTLPANDPASDAFGFTMDGDAPVVARFVMGSSTGLQTPSNLRVERFENSWVTIGSDIVRTRSTWTLRPSLVRDPDGALYVGFDDGDTVTSNGFVRRHVANGTFAGWEPLGPALDLVLDAEVTAPRLRVSATGQLFAAWTERYEGAARVYAARWDENRWTTLAQALDLRTREAIVEAALTVDEHGNPNVLFTQAGVLHAARYNGSPALPFGISRRASTAGCVMPEDASMSFPQTLTATGCFTDVAKRVPIAGAIPFELNSALWSDGAYKRRYLVIPDGETIGYAATGAFTMPVGTIIVKEFLYPTVAGNASTLIPMETRFLVKRCDDGAAGCVEATAWQGYSYQWNPEHTEATLLPDAASTLAWPYSEDGMATTHVHSYPSRQQCVQCHNRAAGRVLGLQAGQLNRSLDYDGVVDNQLRVLEHIGVLTNMGSEAPPRLPAPNDQSFGLEARVRGYFHANCSHCHRAGGMQLTVDFRYEAPFSATNVCNKLVPGDPDQSRLYRKDSYRGPAPMPAFGSEPGGGQQMPPFATLIQDPRQLAVTYAWIDAMQSCP
jgi:hypothetical protein